MVQMNELLKEHVKELKKALENWKRYKEFSFEKFRKDVDIQNMCFYAMFTAIQSSIDIGNDLIAIKNLEEPLTYKEIFDVLSDSKTINKKLARGLQSLVGFRNVLSHLYWKVDLKKAYKILKNGDTILVQFLKIVEKFYK